MALYAFAVIAANRILFSSRAEGLTDREHVYAVVPIASQHSATSNSPRSLFGRLHIAYQSKRRNGNLQV